MGKLTGKVAVVTGASKGIGAGIAEEFAREGASVVVNYSSSGAEAEAVVKKIKAAGGKAKAVRADVSKPAEAKELVKAAVDEFGKVDILVNNAGVYESTRRDYREALRSHVQPQRPRAGVCHAGRGRSVRRGRRVGDQYFVGRLADGTGVRFGL